MIERRTVPFTNLDKVFWPDEGYTKGDLIDYHRQVAEWMLPYLQDPNAAPFRNTIFSETFQPNGMGPYEKVTRTVRDQRFKLVRTARDGGGTYDELFDLANDPDERRNLLHSREISAEAQLHRARLVAALEALVPG